MRPEVRRVLERGTPEFRRQGLKELDKACLLDFLAHVNDAEFQKFRELEPLAQIELIQRRDKEQFDQWQASLAKAEDNIALARRTFKVNLIAMIVAVVAMILSLLVAVLK